MTYVFYGNDVKLIKNKVHELEKKIFSLNEEIEKIYLESFNLRNIDDIYSEGLFYSLKYIRVYVQKFDEISFLLSRDTKNFLVIVFYTDEEPKKVESKIEALNKNGFNIELNNCFLPKPYQISNVLSKKFGNKLSPIIIDFLSKNITSMTDLNKLDEFLKNRKDISIHDIPYILEEIDVSVFSIVDDIISGKKEPSILEINNLNTDYKSQLISSLFYSLKILYNLKKMLRDKISENEIQQKMGLNPFIFKKYLDIAKRLDFEKLRNNLLFFPILDMETKKHATNFFLESFIINFQ